MSRKALVIEDDPDIARLVQLHLGDIQCSAELAADGLEGLAKYRSGAFDLVAASVHSPIIRLCSFMMP